MQTVAKLAMSLSNSLRSTLQKPRAHQTQPQAGKQCHQHPSPSLAGPVTGRDPDISCWKLR